MTILLFNNQIYGLTKGQYSPTSEVGKVTKSTLRLPRHPFDPCPWPSGPRRLRGPDPRHGPQAHDRGLPAGVRAPGRGLVEVFQNCNVFNDGAFEGILAKGPGRHADPAASRRADPLRPRRRMASCSTGVRCRIVDVADVARTASSCTTRPATTRAWRSAVPSPGSPRAHAGRRFRAVVRPVYAGRPPELASAQERGAPATCGAAFLVRPHLDGQLTFRLAAARPPRRLTASVCGRWLRWPAPRRCRVGGMPLDSPRLHRAPAGSAATTTCWRWPGRRSASASMRSSAPTTS